MMMQTNKTTQFPPGITTHEWPAPFGAIFEFEHADLGIVGRLWLVSRGEAGTGIGVDADGDPDDPLWEERFSLFHVIMRACARGDRRLRACTFHGGSPCNHAALSTFLQDRAQCRDVGICPWIV